MQTDISKAIDYAIKMNEAEGLYLSEDDRAMFEKVRNNEITADEYGKIIDLKYKLLGAGKRITSYEAAKLLLDKKNGG